MPVIKTQTLFLHPSAGFSIGFFKHPYEKHGFASAFKVRVRGK